MLLETAKDTNYWIKRHYPGKTNTAEAYASVFNDPTPSVVIANPWRPPRCPHKTRGIKNYIKRVLA